MLKNAAFWRWSPGGALDKKERVFRLCLLANWGAQLFPCQRMITLLDLRAHGQTATTFGVRGKRSSSTKLLKCKTWLAVFAQPASYDEATTSIRPVLFLTDG